MKAAPQRQRTPEVMLPSPVAMAVKRALGRPVVTFVRYPVGKDQWHTVLQRIA